jgi:hypothetical protein
MDNLKKNMHFVVFGVGVLLGIIFLVVGIVIRGGTEDAIAEELTKLAGAQKVPTQGTFDKAKKNASRFGDSLTAAETVLTTGVGRKFESDFTTHPDGRTFYTNEANAKLSQLKTRFEAMEKPLKLPGLLEGWKMATSGAALDPLGPLANEMTNPPTDKIREMQMRLRLLDEIATTMEKLLETGAGEGLGVKLREVKFQGNFGPIATSEADSPWLAMALEFQVDCAPSFSVLLAEELVNPSQRTLKPTTPAEAGKPSYQRIGFPILLEMVQTVMIGRQPEMKLDIRNEDKAGVLAALNNMMGPGEEKLPVPQDPKALDPEKPDGKRLVDEAVKAMNEKDRLVMPVTAGFKIRAASFNLNWRAVKEEAAE